MHCIEIRQVLGFVLCLRAQCIFFAEYGIKEFGGTSAPKKFNVGLMLALSLASTGLIPAMHSMFAEVKISHLEIIQVHKAIRHVQ